MIYKIKCRKAFTTNSDRAISLIKNGFKLQAVSYFVTGTGKQFYTLSKQ